MGLIDNLKFSIITINYNNCSGLVETIESVISQSYSNLEYIIVDGNSNDGSRNIIERFGSQLAKVIIEKDDGIFDAMNKGIKSASGDYIMFMNSGDTFYSNLVLEKLNKFIQFEDYPDIIYGKTVIKYDEKYSKENDPGDKIKFEYGLPFCHQSMLIKHKIQDLNKFNTKYKIYAAYDNYYRLWLNGYTFTYWKDTIACYSYDGISSKLSFKGLKEKYLIGSKYKRFNSLKFAKHVIDKSLRELLKKLFPYSLKRKIQISK